MKNVVWGVVLAAVSMALIAIKAKEANEEKS